MNSQIVRDKIKKLFVNNQIIPLKFIQGEENFNILRKAFIKRKLFKKSTALYEGRYRNNPVVVKIYVKKEKNLMRFKRETYGYKVIPKKYAFSKNLFPKIYLHGITPFPFLVLEKIKGEILGDWYKMNRELPIYKLRKLFTIYKKLHLQITLPNHLAYYFPTNFNNFFRFNKKIKKSLSLSTQLKSIWRELIKKKERLARIYASSQKGFVFTDFSPSNIFKTSTNFKFIDLETISKGSKFYDLATFYFSTIPSTSQKENVYLVIKKMFLRGKEDVALFSFFIIWHILFNFHLSPFKKEFYLKEANKFLYLLNENLFYNSP